MPPRRVLVSRRASSGESRRSVKWVSKPWIRVQPSTSTRRSASSASKRSINTMRVPATGIIRAPSYMPKTWKSGRYMRVRSRGPMPSRLAWSVTLRTSRWEWTTPFGFPVLPEVNMMSAGASGSNAAASASSRSAGTSSPRSSSSAHETAPGASSDARAGPSTITRRRSGQRRSGCGFRGPSRSPGSTSSAISRKSTGPERSASIRVEASDAARAYARSWVRRRTLRGSTTAPILSAPKKACSQAGRLGSHSASFSPGTTPAARRPRAARSTSRSNSSNVQRRPSKTSASREPKRRAARDGSAPSATRSNQSPTGPSPLAAALRSRGAESRRPRRGREAPCPRTAYRFQSSPGLNSAPSASTPCPGTKLTSIRIPSGSSQRT